LVKENVVIGDICEVIRLESIFDKKAPIFSTAIKEDGRYEQYDGKAVVLHEEVRILYIARNKKIILIETINNPKLSKCLIDIKGLKFIREASPSEVYVKEYLLGKTITKMVPDKRVSEELIDAIILKSPMDIQFIKAKLLSNDHYSRVLLKDGGLLGLIPEKRRTLELCRLAVLNEEYAEKFVPEELKSLVNS